MPIECVVIDGDPREAIAALPANVGAQLLFMTESRHPTGSMIETLLRTAPVPVLVTKRPSVRTRKELERDMRVSQIMVSPVETIGMEEPAERAWERMRASGVRHLVVMDGKRIVGVVSDRDRSRPAGPGVTVADVMTRDPVTTTPHATVRELANALRGNVIGCVPVVDGERLVGIVTTTDVLDLVGRGAERPVEQGKRWTLKHRGPRQGKLRRTR